MPESDLHRSSAMCANTPSCWEMHGKFFVEFEPWADLSCFATYKGVAVDGTNVMLESARIKQSYLQDQLKIYVGGSEMPLIFSHELIVGIFDEESGRVWD